MNNIESESAAKLRQLRDRVYQSRDIRDYSTWAERDEAVARLIVAENDYNEALLNAVARHSRG
jgi:hypothetical protein